MLFNSFTFPVFLLIVLSLYLCLARRWQNRLLLFSSYLFYAWWDWRFVALLLYVTFVNYLAGLKIAEARPKSGGEGGVSVHSPREKLWLWTAVAISLGLLGFFKYFNFFADSLVHLLNILGFGATPFTLRILLPVGISFFTFQALAYTIDIYRGKETVQRDFSLFALYISFFPQLVAGPIERSTRLIPQLKKRRVVTKEMIASASQLILVGYFKKIFLADGVAAMVSSIFDRPDGFCGLALLLGAYLFALQIYGDFSGYTDIARGVARLFGIELCLNFRQPYFASNITDFWRRWHISLSTWLRDYLYIPLGGNRKGKGRTYLNLMLTMLLGGLWHGANWTFVVWGGLHGFFLMAHKFILGGKKVPSNPSETIRGHLSFGRIAGYAAGWFLTFHLVVFAWIFFRAESISSALDYIGGILHFARYGHFAGLAMYAAHFLFYALAIGVIDLLCILHNSEVPFTTKQPALLRAAGYAVMIFLILYIGASDVQPFIYFQF